MAPPVNTGPGWAERAQRHLRELEIVGEALASALRPWRRSAVIVSSMLVVIGVALDRL